LHHYHKGRIARKSEKKGAEEQRAENGTKRYLPKVKNARDKRKERIRERQEAQRPGEAKIKRGRGPQQLRNVEEETKLAYCTFT